jgi:single-strand DNA-binding protein
MLNHITLMGRLTRDPELRRTGSGIPVASFTLACDRDFGAKGQEKETDFVDVVAWRNTAEFVSKYFAKGRMAVVSGRLQIRNWTDKDGTKRRNAEILADSVYFGDSKQDGQKQQPAQNFPSQYHVPQYGEPNQYSAPQYSGPQYGAGSYDYPAPAQVSDQEYSLLEGYDEKLPF